MGFNSTIMICNDCIDAIEKDPAGWWTAAWEALSLGKLPQRFGIGGCVNGFLAVAQHHADVHSVIAVGGNYATVLWQGMRGIAGHHEEADIIKLLKAAASKYGYRLVKKPGGGR
jgi:hypothetical protein